MDDRCIGYYVDNQLAGFITFKYRDDKAIVGLVGVFPEFQKKGISQKLLDYVNYNAINQGFRQVSISTQGRNLKAINAYIKNGFFLDSIKYWYYLKGGKI